MKLVTDTDALKTSSEKIKGMVDTYIQYYQELSQLLSNINDWQGKDRMNFEKTTGAALKRLEKLLNEMNEARECLENAKNLYEDLIKGMIDMAKKI